MVSRESVNEVFLPDKEDCLEYLRDHRWPDEVMCPHCESADTIKKGTTRKGAQRYQCKNCNSIFNDLTETVFAEHQLSIPEIFHIISKMKGQTTNDIFKNLIGRTRQSWTTYIKSKTFWKKTPNLTSTGSVKLTKSTSLRVRKAPSRRVRASADSKKGTRNLRVRQTASRDTRPSERRTSSVPRS
jgi:predicted RNA-binding Zn-ribbon protein involved in translation (DUF1610 family)